MPVAKWTSPHLTASLIDNGGRESVVYADLIGNQNNGVLPPTTMLPDLSGLDFYIHVHDP